MISSIIPSLGLKGKQVWLIGSVVGDFVVEESGYNYVRRITGVRDNQAGFCSQNELIYLLGDNYVRIHNIKSGISSSSQRY